MNLDMKFFVMLVQIFVDVFRYSKFLKMAGAQKVRINLYQGKCMISYYDN